MLQLACLRLALEKNNMIQSKSLQSAFYSCLQSAVLSLRSTLTDIQAGRRGEGGWAYGRDLTFSKKIAVKFPTPGKIVKM